MHFLILGPWLKPLLIVYFFFHSFFFFSFWCLTQLDIEGVYKFSVTVISCFG